MKLHWFVLAILISTLPVLVQAQTCPTVGPAPNFNSGGQVFGRLDSQWNAYFSTYPAANNGVLCNPTIVGQLSLTQAHLSVASLIISGALTANGMGSSISNAAITNLPFPVNPFDAAPKVYVDQTIHEPAAASTGLTTALPTNVYNNGAMGVGATLTASSNGALTIDGYSVNAGDRVLIPGEITPANDGIYVVTSPGSGSAPYVLKRASDFNQIANITAGSSILVYGGSTNSGSYDLTTTGTINVGTTPLLFAKSVSSSGALVPLTPGALATTAALPANTYSNGTLGVGATLTATTNAALTVDSVVVTSAQRILVKNEAAPANNGVYTVTTVGSGSVPYVLTRTTDFDTSAQILNDTYIFISGGTLNAKTGWILNSTGIPTIGTTAINFQQFSGATSYTAGTGLQLTGSQFAIPSAGVTAGLLASGAAASNLGFTPLNPASNLSDLASAASARTNLGLGSLAVLSALPTPTPSILGGVFSFPQQTNQFLTALATNGTFTAATLNSALVSPPPIGTTTPNAGNFSTLVAGSASANPVPGIDTNLSATTGVINSGTFVNNIGVGVFIKNDLASVGPGNSQNIVLHYGLGNSDVNSAWTWGLNPVLYDTAALSGTGLINELDFNVNNASTTVYGLLLQGASTAQPTGTHPAIEVAPLDIQNGSSSHISWSYGLLTLPAAAAVGVHLAPATDAGTAGASQAIELGYVSGGGANLTTSIIASSTHILTVQPPNLAGTVTGVNTVNNSSGTNGTAAEYLVSTLHGQGQIAETESSGLAQLIVNNTGSGGLNLLPGSGGLLINNVAAVSCSAGTVNLTTLVITNGIVTHC